MTVAAYPPLDGPNYMGFATSNQHRVIGSTFTTTAWVDIHSAVDTASIDNLTFQPAGILYYSPPTVQGNAWSSPYVWITPESDLGGTTFINNATGYANPITMGKNSLNSVNRTLATITWLPHDCGKTTISIVAGGTALAMVDPGTTKHSLDIWVHPMNATGFSAVAHNTTQIDLSWTKQTGDSKVVIRYKSGSAPTSVTDGTALYNGSGTTTSQGGLAGGQTVYYSAWGWNTSGSIYSLGYKTASGTTPLPNAPPVIGTPSPANNSVNEPRSLTWSVPMSDPNGDHIVWNIRCSHGEHTGAIGDTNGTKSISLSGLAYSVTYTIYANVSDGTTLVEKWFQFTTLANVAPSFGTPSPTNSSTSQPRTLTWSIPISDGNGDHFDWTIQCSNGQHNQATSATNGTKSVSLSGLAKLTLYKVYVNATDGIVTTRAWYQFTTMDNLPPTYGTPSPANGSASQPISFTWQIAITDPEGDSISAWSIQCTNGQSRTGLGSSGLTASLSLSGLAFSTTYKVFVNSTDSGSGSSTHRWYQFTTKANSPPNAPDYPFPSNDSTNVAPDIGGLLVRVVDPDGQTLTVRFYWGNGTLIGTKSGVVSGQYASISIPVLPVNTNFTWYVNVSDGTLFTRGPASGDYTFMTGVQPSGGLQNGESNVVILVLVGSTPVNAAVIAINSGTSVQSIGAVVQTAATGTDGTHRFILPSGNYIITVTAPGLRTYQKTMTVNGGTVTIEGTRVTTTGLASLVVYMTPTFDIFPYLLLALVILLIIIGYLLYRRGKKPWYQK